VVKMDNINLIENIADKNVDIDKYVEKVLKDSGIRKIILENLFNNVKVDELNLFSGVYEKYIKSFDDKKFMTADCFVKNLKKIVHYRNDYEKQVIELLVKVDKVTNHTHKQKELMKSTIIELFESIYESSENKSIIYEFIKNQSGSISPKTRKSVKIFLRNHNG